LKKCIKDLVFYSKTPGSGFRLLKEAKTWVDGWGDSVYNAYLGTSTSNDKIDDMYERWGMKKIGSQFVFERGEL